MQHPQGYANAAELVEARSAHRRDLKSRSPCTRRSIPSSPTIEHEIDNFKRKLDAGATRGISQFFFEADIFLRFRDRLATRGRRMRRSLPGIMPVTNVKGLAKMAEACGATLPRWMVDLFEGLDDDPETRRLVAAVTTAQLCARLAAEGRRGFPLLHAQPRRSCVGDLPHRRRALRRRRSA